MFRGSFGLGLHRGVELPNLSMAGWNSIPLTLFCLTTPQALRPKKGVFHVDSAGQKGGEMEIMK